MRCQEDHQWQLHVFADRRHVNQWRCQACTASVQFEYFSRAVRATGMFLHYRYSSNTECTMLGTSLYNRMVLEGSVLKHPFCWLWQRCDSVLPSCPLIGQPFNSAAWTLLFLAAAVTWTRWTRKKEGGGDFTTTTHSLSPSPLLPTITTTPASSPLDSPSPPSLFSFVPGLALANSSASISHPVLQTGVFTPFLGRPTIPS